MPGVERLHHVERLRPADLADDDSIRPEPQGVADEITHRDVTDPLDVGSPALEAHDVALEPEFGCILDRHDSIGRRYQRAQDVEEGRLAGTRRACNEDVLSFRDRTFQLI